MFDWKGGITDLPKREKQHIVSGFSPFLFKNFQVAQQGKLRLT